MMKKPLVPIVFVSMIKGAETVMLNALLDSGVGASLMTAKYCNTLKTATKKGSFKGLGGVAY
eukprot:14546578-Ditylum_brightwellii.AAC.1